LASEERLRREYEQQIQVKEQELLQRLSDEKEQLNVERLAVEQSLQREMDKKLEDQNERLQQLLRDEQQRLARVIEQRDGQCRMLESALNQEVAKEKETALQAKEELLANFASLLEVEMQCSICSELFVKATSLSCSHSFCEFCLNQWLAVKKDCPVCRAPVTSRYRSVVLDNYIEKMVEHLSDDMKQKRRVIIDERRGKL
jgi:E3 ubiquitin-protein ligase RNF8